MRGFGVLFTWFRHFSRVLKAWLEIKFNEPLGIMDREIEEIFEKVTERYEVPIRLGSRCESHVYYRIEDLSPEDVEVCAQYIAGRIINVCSPSLPNLLIPLPGSFSDLAFALSKELGSSGEPIEIMELKMLNSENGVGQKLRTSTVVLVNDVITTARSCLEAHTKTTVMGAQVLCWASLVDRTFGPGPVPVVSSLTGEPVTLLEELP